MHRRSPSSHGRRLLMVTLANDYGGNIAAYATYFDVLKEQGESIRVNGPCASACTLFFRLPDGRYCATEKAELQLHAGSSRVARDVMLRSYPEKLRDWIDAHGGLTERWLQIRAPLIYEFVPKCEEGK